MSKNSYLVIFQSTFIFGFVQVYNLIVKVLVNKVAALLLGPSGIGLIYLYSSVIGVVKTVAGLGVSQSAVKYISDTNENDKSDVPVLVYIVNILYIFTAVVGFCVVILLSSFFDSYITKNLSIFSYVCIGFAVSLTILWEGQLSIIKGLRDFNSIAKASIYSATFSIFVCVVIYYIFRDDGVIPVLVVTPLFSLVFALFYAKKYRINGIVVSNSEFHRRAMPILLTGLALSSTIILSQISSFILSLYIGNTKGLHLLGLYNAGLMVMTGYFSTLINALTTDYYPRIAAMKDRDIDLKLEVNRQSIVSVLLCLPLVVAFQYLLPYLISLLFTKEFLDIKDFVGIGIFGVVIAIFSNQLDLILIVKNKSRLYFVIALVYRVFEVVLSIFMFSNYGLLGMGYAMMITSIFHFIVMLYFVNLLFGINYSSEFSWLFSFLVFFMILSSSVSVLDQVVFNLTFGLILFISAMSFSLYYAKVKLGVNLVKLFGK